jgi:hypothetical protein
MITPSPQEFRLYYNPEDGTVAGYSAEPLESGVYIVIDKQTFLEHRFDVRVINQRVVRVNSNTTSRLRVADVGTPCDPDDITLVVNKADRHLLWARH